jgi:ubiquitin C-terminal hydrolase
MDGIKIEKKFMYFKKLPKILVINIKRFATKQFFNEINPTIVFFPLVDLDMFDFCNLKEEDKFLVNTKYNLISNIIFEGDLKNGSYQLQILNKSNNKWYHIVDLEIKEIVQPQEISISKSYIQIFELKE